MYLVLPTDEADGLESLIELEGKLANTSLFSRLVDSMTRKTTIVQLPRFRLQQKLNLKVNEFLQGNLVAHHFIVDIVLHRNSIEHFAI